jgi:sulfite reductase (NADPH) flavoprotein alpha-component
VEQAWRLPPGTLRAETGQGTIALFEDMARGAIKACWIICTNPVASVANRAKVIAGLDAAELVITQDASWPPKPMPMPISCCPARSGPKAMA